MTTTTPKSLQGAIAVSADTDITPLGYVTWFSLPDEQVSLRTLRHTLGVVGLPRELAPRDLKAINAFKRAMRQQDGRHRGADGAIRDNTVDLVVETATECIYQVAVTRRLPDERVVEYPKALRAIFLKESEEIRFNRLGDIPRDEVYPLTEAIQSYVDQNGAKVTGAKVRGIVRNYLRSEPDEDRGIYGLAGENLRGKAGGVYFIQAKYREQLEQLAEMLERLYHGRAYLHMVAMADSASEREIVRRHHIANAQGEMKEAIAELRALLTADRDTKIRKDAVKHAWSKYRAMLRRVARYETILGEAQDEIQAQARILKTQLDKLPDLD